MKDSTVFVRQSQTTKELWVLILYNLLDAVSGHSVLILTIERGTNRWSYRGASATVRKVRAQIGALVYDIFSWRYNAACDRVGASCSDDLVATVTGQSPAMVLHYTKNVRQRIRTVKAQQIRSDQKRT